MRVLLIGKGGREHALAWKLSQSELLGELLLWPESPVMQSLGQKLDVPPDASFPDLAAAARAARVDLVVSGPEAPLSLGLADAFAGVGIPCFGPRQAAARLESSKAFAKEVMQSAKIPTAAHCLASNASEGRRAAEAMLGRQGGVVLKASGLAAGKGVFVCFSVADLDNAFGHLYGPDMALAAQTVVVEEVLQGRECSYFTMLGKNGATGLGFAVDYKRLEDGDLGPNTGGMGCYAPVPWLPKGAESLVVETVVEPLLKELAARDLPYTGCLYVGLMWSKARGPKVVEFNVRLGDPEAEVLAVFDDRDWLALMAMKCGLQVPSAAAKEWETPSVPRGAAVAVVMASPSYPYGKDAARAASLPKSLFALTPEKSAKAIFGASLKAATQDRVETGAGRVLVACSRGETFTEARTSAYKLVEETSRFWPSAKWRRDIGLIDDFLVSASPPSGSRSTSLKPRPTLILGSSSPRRRDLLETIGLSFEVFKPETAEVPRPGEKPDAYVRRNADEKATWILERLAREARPECLVISADTVVVLDDDILEKPHDSVHAAEMLRRLSGKTHTVMTGVTLAAKSLTARADNRRVTFSVHTDVRLKSLSEHEIAAYIQTGEPLDKAGAYAAQGIGSYIVLSLVGSYTNVVGLPVAEVVDCLENQFAFPLWGS